MADEFNLDLHHMRAALGPDYASGRTPQGGFNLREQSTFYNLSPESAWGPHPPRSRMNSNAPRWDVPAWERQKAQAEATAKRVAPELAAPMPKYTPIQFKERPNYNTHTDYGGSVPWQSAWGPEVYSNSSYLSPRDIVRARAGNNPNDDISDPVIRYLTQQSDNFEAVQAEYSRRRSASSKLAVQRANSGENEYLDAVGRGLASPWTPVNDVGKYFHELDVNDALKSGSASAWSPGISKTKLNDASWLRPIVGGMEFGLSSTAMFPDSTAAAGRFQTFRNMLYNIPKLGFASHAVGTIAATGLGVGPGLGFWASSHLGPAMFNTVFRNRGAYGKINRMTSGDIYSAYDRHNMNITGGMKFNENGSLIGVTSTFQPSSYSTMNPNGAAALSLSQSGKDALTHITSVQDVAGMELGSRYRQLAGTKITGRQRAAMSPSEGVGRITQMTAIQGVLKQQFKEANRITTLEKIRHEARLEQGFLGTGRFEHPLQAAQPGSFIKDRGELGGLIDDVISGGDIDKLRYQRMAQTPEGISAMKETLHLRTGLEHASSIDQSTYFGKAKAWAAGGATKLLPKVYTGGLKTPMQVATMLAAMDPSLAMEVLSPLTGNESAAVKAIQDQIRGRAESRIGVAAKDLEKEVEPTMREFFQARRQSKFLKRAIPNIQDPALKEKMLNEVNSLKWAGMGKMFVPALGALDVALTAKSQWDNRGNPIGVMDATASMAFGTALYGTKFGQGLLKKMTLGGARFGGNASIGAYKFGRGVANVATLGRSGRLLGAAKSMSNMGLWNITGKTVVGRNVALNAVVYGRGSLLKAGIRGVGTVAGGALGLGMSMLPGLAYDIYAGASDWAYNRYEEKMRNYASGSNPGRAAMNSYMADPRSQMTLATERQRAAMFAKQSQMSFYSAMGEEATLFHM